MHIKDQKRLLRRKISEVIAQLTVEQIFAQSLEVFDKIETLQVFKSAGKIAIFWSLPDEIYTHDFINKWQGSKDIYLPVVKHGEMRFHHYSSQNMHPGELGIMEPADGEIISATELDLVIVPGVAFDAQGYRLGRGKGYYDRYLGETEAYTVGVCLKHQLIDKVPKEQHDIKVDIVLYPEN